MRMLMTLAVSVIFATSICSAEKRHYSILPLGDSITQGAGPCTSYTYPLWKELTAAGYDFEYVGPRQKTYDVGVLHHCGFGGKNVEYLEKHIEEFYGKYTADVVFLHAGHNHFIEENPVEGMIEAHRSIIDKILVINPDAYIFVAQVIPSGKLPKYSYIPEFNRQVKKLVRSYHSKHIILVNVAKGFEWEKFTADDKVHPNPEGADHMSHRWMKAIRKHLKVEV